MKIISFWILIFLSLESCNSQNKLNCISKLREESKKDSLSLELISKLKDSVEHWHNIGVERFQNYKNAENWFWDDLIIFNISKNKGISFIYQMIIDTSSNHPSNVQLYGVEYKDNVWHYYLEGMPTIAFFKNMNGGRPFTLEQLKTETAKQLIDHMEGDSCGNFGNLVDSWFAPEQGLEKAEIKFWNRYYESKNKEK